MSREVHVRFWEGVGVQLPHASRLFFLSFKKLCSRKPLYLFRLESKALLGEKFDGRIHHLRIVEDALIHGNLL